MDENFSNDLHLRALRAPVPKDGENERKARLAVRGTNAVAALFRAALPEIATFEVVYAAQMEAVPRRMLAFLGFKRAILDSSAPTTLAAIIAAAERPVCEALKNEPPKSIPEFLDTIFQRRFMERSAPMRPPQRMNVNELVCVAKQGELAMDQLLRSNIGLIIKQVTRSYQQRPLWPDMVAEGLMGLRIAILRFEPHRGKKLVAFALPWINHKIQKYLLINRRMIRMPVNSFQTMRLVMAAHVAISRERNAKGESPQYPDSFEISRRSGLKEKEVRLFFLIQSSTLSLNEPIGATNGDRSEPLMDRLPDQAQDPEAALLAKEKLGRIIALFESKLLKEQERRILLERIINERTLEDVGADYGVSRERIRQIQSLAISKLRAAHPDGFE